jgi:type IV secretion system protein VirB10
MGRAGVRGTVNRHLLDRLANTFLQAGSNLGQAFAGRQLPPQVIVAAPGTAQAVSSSIADPQQIRPTLTVKPGARVSVFVARDLDFSSVDPQ